MKCCARTTFPKMQIRITSLADAMTSQPLAKILPPLAGDKTLIIVVYGDYHNLRILLHSLYFRHTIHE